MDTGTEQTAAAEVAEHHRFIEAWLRGTADPGRLAEFVEMHTPDFTLCGPDGGAVGRDAIASGFGAGHGTAPGISVEIRGARLVAAEGISSSPPTRSTRRRRPASAAAPSSSPAIPGPATGCAGSTCTRPGSCRRRGDRRPAGRRGGPGRRVPPRSRGRRRGFPLSPRPGLPRPPALPDPAPAFPLTPPHGVPRHGHGEAGAGSCRHRPARPLGPASGGLSPPSVLDSPTGLRSRSRTGERSWTGR
ncbi:hypothetical protein ACFQXA_05435 [Nocardiopsis composta]